MRGNMINRIRIVDSKIVGCPIGMVDPQDCLKCEYCNSAVTLGGKVRNVICNLDM